MRFILAISVLVCVHGQSDPPVPVDELDINAYIGLWYNVRLSRYFGEVGTDSLA